MKISEYFTRICIPYNGSIFKLFTIWYFKDWWYFITDIADSSEYLYTAMKATVNYHDLPFRQKFKLPFDQIDMQKITVNDPKISHHMDGTCHISWKWIRSGYDKNLVSKWLSVNSGSLDWGNDWWPMFIFSVWVKRITTFPSVSLDSLSTSSKKHLIFWEKSIVDMTNGISPSNYIIEWYYYHKSLLPPDMSYWKFLTMHHPAYWKVILAPIPSPPECPYIFNLLCIKEFFEFSDMDNFCYWWAPWIVWSDWFYDTLHLFSWKESPAKNSLDY